MGILHEKVRLNGQTDRRMMAGEYSAALRRSHDALPLLAGEDKGGKEVWFTMISILWREKGSPRVRIERAAVITSSR
ncbi:hypothetical protein [Arthrobacter sp. RAF14]|uniref:hypothetical protein n=1 Tax=Arthrobacter sp. RAF14 TaxID=3233051 RepID=UPI003F8DB11E